MIETMSAEELARDPGYPGMVPGHVAQTVYYAPFKKLTEADLEGFWVLEYRWPNGCTPYGLMFCELALTWAMQYASHHSPLPPTNGYASQHQQLVEFQSCGDKQYTSIGWLSSLKRGRS